jgi:pyridoxine/pyridoxamine 5'-phosphate oxidase
MQIEELYQFIQSRKLAVISTTAPNGDPQSALVGIAVSPNLSIVFDTVKSSRKYPNLKADPRISMVIGWEGEVTLQYEGIASEPQGETLRDAKDIYFQTWPSCVDHQQWPGITWFLVKPVWIRYSDFDTGRIEEMSFPLQSQ